MSASGDAVSYTHLDVYKRQHVLGVLSGPTRVILGVLFGVATGAKGSFTRSRKHHRYDITSIGCFAKEQNHILDHLGGVGIKLSGIVEDLSLIHI